MKTKQDPAGNKGKTTSGNPDSQTFSDDPAIIDQALKDQQQSSMRSKNKNRASKEKPAKRLHH